MKRYAPLLLLAAAAPALAASETLLSFDDPAVYFASALGRQVNIRFTDSFVASHLPQADYRRRHSQRPFGRQGLFLRR